ncbi:MAG TPA: transglycosylase domain-containing protein [Dehalococcoidia bacterium]|nr:transglycosylase domain-containing protein [Dehalococcoidia bacterium]
MTRAHRFRRLRHQRRRSGNDTRPLFLALLAPLLIAVFAGVAGIAAAATSYYAQIGSRYSSPEEAIAARGGGARIFDRNGTLLYEFLDPTVGLRYPVSLDQVSPLLQDATIAAEDASFYTNPGINVRGIGRATVENLKPGDSFLQGSGGSSITQQLVKQIYFSPKERTERTFSRKLREAVLAVKITQEYDKHQILEWYLNEVPYGGVLTGIEAASEGYFGIRAKDLDLAQAAFLAGLPQSPSEYDPFTHYDAAKQRQSEVLDLMVKHGYITAEQAAWARLEVLELHPKDRPFLAPHFVLYVADYIKATLGEDALYHGGLDVVTTLDLTLNDRANAILEQNLEKYENSTNGHNGAVVIIDPPTGQILAMVGSRDYYRDDVDGTVNNALALNSPGSTLKPFTYATAFEQGWSPDWPIVDTPITYTSPGEPPFAPRNPDGKSHGVIPVKVALGNSFNIPAFKTILWVGVPNMVATAKAMGITTLDRDLGPAVTLGGVDVKLLDMVFGYATFANNGVQAGIPATHALPAGNRQLDPNPVLEITRRDGRVVLDNTQPKYAYPIKPQYAYMITDVLTNDDNRSITYGHGSNLNIPGYKVAVKTGTSEPYENSRLIGDTWTFGYTPNIAVGVWVGNSDNTPMVNIFSTTIAGQTWHDVIVEALKGKPALDWTRPDGLETATVCVPSGLRAPAGGGCPTVTGLFATEALDRVQADDYWGGQQLSQPLPASQRLNSIPGEVSGWRRYLAQEYQRSYRGGARPAQQPRPPAPPAQPPPPAGAPPNNTAPAQPTAAVPPGQQRRR